MLGFCVRSSLLGEGVVLAKLISFLYGIPVKVETSTRLIKLPAVQLDNLAVLL